MSVFTTIYKYVSQIPPGKVATYGQIARIYNQNHSKPISPQLIGFALHANSNSSIPCHRVVDKSGRLAPNFSFGGLKIQKQLLQKEKIVFKKNNHLDLKKYQVKL